MGLHQLCLHSSDNVLSEPNMLIDLVEFVMHMRIILKLSSVRDNYSSTAEFREINHLCESSAGL